AVNPSVRAMDAGGDNVRSLMRSAANMPNQTRESARKALDSRQSNQWVRLENDLEATLAPGRAFGQTVDDLVAMRKINAQQAFEKAYAAPFTVKPDDDLAKFLTERGYMRRMLEKTDETISGMTGQSAQQSQGRPWEFLHRVKMEIDREISRLKSGQQDS